MRFLIIEDNEAKSAQLSRFLESEFDGIVLGERRSYNTGLSAIKELVPDIVLLDMSMPTFDRRGTQTGGRTRYYAGRDVLSEMRRLNLASKAIVVTQFDTFGEGTQTRTLGELKSELEEEFPDRYLGTVYYHPSRFDWKLELKRQLVAAGVSLKGSENTP